MSVGSVIAVDDPVRECGKWGTSGAEYFAGSGSFSR